MKKFLFALLPLFLLAGCATNNVSSSVAPASSASESQSSEPAQEVKLVVDYTNDGGANIPTSWNDGDTAETVRTATYTVGDQQFKMDFVGKWYNSSNKQEYQTKKDPASYVRAASDLVVKRLVVEVFQTDAPVYLTRDHSGSKLTGTPVDAVHSDGDAISYEINSKDWSVFAEETYKGSSVNFYSFTFYF